MYSWCPLTSKVPLGLIIGPILLSIFTSDLDEETQYNANNLANNT